MSSVTASRLRTGSDRDLAVIRGIVLRGVFGDDERLSSEIR
jgi:hypothetical protein